MQVITSPLDTELLIEATNKGFLNYNDPSNPRIDTVQNFYRENRKNMTLDYVLDKKKTICKLEKAKMSLWDALLLLDDIVDDSDPDTSLSQLGHALQTAEVCFVFVFRF